MPSFMPNLRSLKVVLRFAANKPAPRTTASSPSRCLQTKAGMNTASQLLSPSICGLWSKSKNRPDIAQQALKKSRYRGTEAKNASLICCKRVDVRPSLGIVTESFACEDMMLSLVSSKVSLDAPMEFAPDSVVLSSPRNMQLKASCILRTV